jgi:hypothetical protein
LHKRRNDSDPPPRRDPRRPVSEGLLSKIGRANREGRIPGLISCDQLSAKIVYVTTHHISEEWPVLLQREVGQRPRGARREPPEFSVLLATSGSSPSTLSPGTYGRSPDRSPTHADRRWRLEVKSWSEPRRPPHGFLARVLQGLTVLDVTTGEAPEVGIGAAAGAASTEQYFTVPQEKSVDDVAHGPLVIDRRAVPWLSTRSPPRRRRVSADSGAIRRAVQGPDMQRRRYGS